MLAAASGLTKGASTVKTNSASLCTWWPRLLPSIVTMNSVGPAMRCYMVKIVMQLRQPSTTAASCVNNGAWLKRLRKHSLFKLSYTCTDGQLCFVIWAWQIRRSRTHLQAQLPGLHLFVEPQEPKVRNICRTMTPQLGTREAPGPVR